MKIFKLILFFCLYVSTLHATPMWTYTHDYPGGGRYAAFAFSVGTFGYIGTGRGTGGTTSAFWSLNTITGAWTQKKDFAGTASNGTTGFSSENHIAFVISGKGYVGMGNGSTNLWEYDPTTNNWTAKASITGVSANLGVAFAIGTKGYFRSGDLTAMGHGNDMSQSDYPFWEYDQPTNTWAKKTDLGRTPSTPMSTPALIRRSPAGFSIAGKGYIGTGLKSAAEGNIPAKDFYEYDPATDSWTQRLDYGGSARFNTISFATATNGYIGLGSDAGSGGAEIWFYTPPTAPVNPNTWAKLPLDFPNTGRAQAIGFSVPVPGQEDDLFVGLGNDGAPQPTIYRYNVTNSQVLAVELTYFNALVNRDKAQVALQWETATEQNNAHFAIERKGSFNDDFQEIGRIKGADNSTKRLTYNWLDEQPINGVVYYRLRTIENNGKIAYSKAVSVSYNKGAKVLIFPTYTEGSVSIDAGTRKIDFVRVFNGAGQLLLQGNQPEIDLSPLPRGVYLVQVKSNNDLFVEKIFRQ
jgi:N-acetylneuraminic acid mutarotase